MKTNLFRILLIGCVLVTSLFVGGAALAQDEELPDPGLTPDSPFYFMDKLGKGLGMAFTFGDDAKAERALQYAEERLAEARAMAAKNRNRETETATEEYDEYMARVRQRVEAAVQSGAADNITERVAAAASNHLAVLEDLKEKLPETAQAGIERAIAASENGQINALRALSRNKPERAVEISQEAIENGLERLRVRATSANGTSGNATGETLNYAARLADLEDELISAAEAAGVDPTRLRQQLAQATTNRLQVLAKVHEGAPEQARAGLENAIENSVRKYERTVEKLREGGDLGDIPEESPAMQRISEAVKNRLRIATAERTQTSGNVTDNASVQTRTRAEVKEEVKQQVETRRAGRDDDDADDASDNASAYDDDEDDEDKDEYEDDEEEEDDDDEDDDDDDSSNGNRGRTASR